MNFLDNFAISLAYSPYYLVAGFLLIILYTYYIYRTTLPPVGKVFKSVLILIRIFILTLLLLLIFDPVLTFHSKEKVYPNNLFFLDNSKSIKEFSSEQDISNLSEIIKNIDENVNGTNQYFSFGKSINKFDLEIDSLNFYQSSTRFDLILDKIKSTPNIASAIILSDGIINEGSNPIYSSSNLSMPIYTIGIGDTIPKRNISIERILTNKFIYTNRETEVEVEVSNQNLSGKETTVYIYDEQKLIAQKLLTLSKTGINRFRFPYKNSKAGVHQLTIKIPNIEDDSGITSGEKSTLINVLESKKKIFIIAGSPSPDLSAVTKSIMDNDEYELKRIIEINSQSYYNNVSNLDSLQFADILFLIDFPSSGSKLKFTSKIEDLVLEYKIPVFFLLGSNIDYLKLSTLSKITPFTISDKSNLYSENQVTSSSYYSGIINKIDNWEKLPPINLSKAKIIPKNSSNILLHEKNNSLSPILFTNNIEKISCIVLNTSNIWKWKLSTRKTDDLIFENLILNSIKWLSAKSSNKVFSVKSSKESYKLGETILFNSSLYNETMEEINDANIILTLNKDQNSETYNFNSLSKGLYELKVNLTKPGKYDFKAKIENMLDKTNTITGTILVEPNELELLENKMDQILLKNISSNSNGEYFSLYNIDKLINELNSNYQNKIYFNMTDNELRLSNFELILMLIVIMLSIEWLLRKTNKMI